MIFMVLVIWALLILVFVLTLRLRDIEKSLDSIRFFDERAAVKMANFAVWKDHVEEEIGKLYVLHELPDSDLPHKKENIV